MTKQEKLRNLEYYDMQNVFDSLYEQSQNNAVFDNLMAIIKSEENIRLAYRNIKRNQGSNTSGTDNIKIPNIEKMSADKYIRIIQNKLTWYKPKSVKRIEIPKPNGKMRPLGIPTVTDRLVQQCILQVPEPICEAKFHERSNGFRPNRSAEHALAQCYRMIQQQNLHFVVDILSLWAAQYGRCAVTGKSLWIDEIHCHHKIPLKNGGSDKYQNLVIVHKNVHGLIHATNSDTVQKYLDLVKPTAAMLKKINKLRLKVGNTAI